MSRNINAVVRSIRDASAIQVSVTLLNLGSSVVLYSLIGHALGPTAFGIWSTTAALCSIVFALCGLGIDAVMCREMAKSPRSSGRIFGTALAMRLAISIPLTILLVPILFHFLRFSGLIVKFAPIYVLYAGVGGLNGLVNRGFQGLRQFSWQLVPGLLSGFLTVGLIATLLWRGRGLLAVVATAAAGQTAAFLAGLWLFNRQRPIELCWRWSDWKELLKESWPLAVSMPFLAAYVRIDSVMLAALKGPESVGLYNTGYTILMGCGALMAAIQTAMFPSLSRLYSESRESAYQVFQRGLRWMALAGIAVFVISLPTANVILGTFFGARFVSAAFSFQILMLAAVFLFLNNLCGVALTAVGQQRWAPRITILGLALNVTLNLLLIPRWDFVGSSIATLATELFVLFFAYGALRPEWREPSPDAGVLRICLVSQEYPDEIIGGIGSYTHNMAHALVQAGHHVVVVARAKEFSRTYTEGAVIICKLAPWPLRFAGVRRYATNLVYSFALAWKLLGVVREHRIDVVEFPEWGAEGLFYSFIRPRPAPMVVRLHTPLKVIEQINQTHRSWPATQFIRLLCWMERRAVLRADRLTAPSMAMSRRCRKALRLPQEIKIYPNPIDTDYFRPAAEQDRVHPNVLYVGQLTKRKGVEVFRSVIPAVLKDYPEASFCFAGRDMIRPETGRPMSEFLLDGMPPDIRNRVSFVGEVRWDQLRKLYQRARVCVLPSLFECFSVAFVEAMACGCLVIGSRSGGMAEIIDHAVDGILIDPDDELQTTRRIIDGLKEASGRMPSRARAKAMRCYSYTAVAISAAQMYRGLLRRPVTEFHPARLVLAQS